MHATQDHKRRSNAEPQRKRRSIIVIGSVATTEKGGGGSTTELKKATGKVWYQTQRCDGKSYLKDKKNKTIEGDCAVDIKLAQMRTK